MTYRELLELLESSIDHWDDDVLLVGEDDRKFSIDSIVNTKNHSFLTINYKSLSKLSAQNTLSNMHKFYHEEEMENFFNTK